MREQYQVRRMRQGQSFCVQVPGSKSITNRALLLAAQSIGSCTLKGVLFSADSRVFLQCLQTLGFTLEVREAQKEVTIVGTGGRIPNPSASVYVGSAGTAARFLTVFLAAAGGRYTVDASAQMRKRPMGPLLDALREAGVAIRCLEEEGHFPFEMESNGIQTSELTIDTTVSSQFASALMMSAALLPQGLTIHLTGSRMAGAYILMTLQMMQQFGISAELKDGTCRILGGSHSAPQQYQIEPDVSAAGYFFAMAPLLRSCVLVQNVHLDSMQGDIRFLEICRQLGCRVMDTSQGVQVDGRGVAGYHGITVDMKEFSDQALTLAAIAPFAEGETRIIGVEHIRKQESDRLMVMQTELGRMGIACEELPEEGGICIHGGSVQPAVIQTYEDHRVAMAFALTGLRAGGIVIDNPACCSKTFEQYFEVLDDLISRIGEKTDETGNRTV